MAKNEKLEKGNAVLPVEIERLVMREFVKLKKQVEKRKIHWGHMHSWNRASCEGYNEGISDILEIIDKKLNKMKKSA